MTRISGEPGAAGAFRIQSSTDPFRDWIVELVTESLLFCGCPAYARRLGCRHSEAARAEYRKERAELEARPENVEARNRRVKEFVEMQSQ